jgi:hypothetical protein
MQAATERDRVAVCLATFVVGVMLEGGEEPCQHS